MSSKKNAPEGDVILFEEAHAEVTGQVPVPKETQTFSPDDVEKIRQQEKDKMYKRLEDADNRVKTMEQQMSVITAEREEAIKKAEEQARKESDILRQREIEELSAKELLLKREDEFNERINTLQNDWQSRLDAIEAERQAASALLEKEREHQQLVSYQQRRMQEEQETIIPELLDLVAGNTVEDIEASISALRERSSAILESIQQASMQQRGNLRGALVTAPAVGPMETQSEQQSLTADDIRNMSMDQYQKMRDRLLNARSSRGRF